jgi:hypothetical protein
MRAIFIRYYDNEWRCIKGSQSAFRSSAQIMLPEGQRTVMIYAVPRQHQSQQACWNFARCERYVLGDIPQIMGSSKITPLQCSSISNLSGFTHDQVLIPIKRSAT